jgi:hypothetical protein
MARRWHKTLTIGESESPATENLIEMLVNLEPVWQSTKDEEEDGETWVGH